MPIVAKNRKNKVEKKYYIQILSGDNTICEIEEHSFDDKIEHILKQPFESESDAYEALLNVETNDHLSFIVMPVLTVNPVTN